MSIWDLNGPTEYVTAIVEELRSRNAIIAAFPKFGPHAFSQHLFSRLDREGFRPIALAWRAGRHPLDFLFQELQIQLQLSERQSIARLAEAIGAAVILLDGIEQKDWSMWKHFFEEFDREFRASGGIEWPLLVGVLEGIALEEIRLNSVAVSVHPWVDTVGELDVLVYARAHTQIPPERSVEREITLRTIARLALWDLGVAQTLSQLSLNELIDPSRALQAVADQRGWHEQTGASWANGTLSTFNGMKVKHSAMLMDSRSSGELRMRVWSAQASVVLPLIEQRRRELVPTAKRHLRMPLIVDGEQVDDVYDLEIGPLCHQLVIRRCPDSSLMRRLRTLKHLRNLMAHVQVAPPALMLDTDLTNPFA